MILNNLIVEVSQKCNLKCEHCLRGPARSTKLDVNKFNSFIRQFDYIHSLTIGGGEPSLALDVIKDVYYAFMYSGVELGNIYIVTNGTYNTMALAEMFIKFYQLCSDNEISGLGFSFDKWHNFALTTRQMDYRHVMFHKVRDLFYENGLNDSLIRKHSNLEWTEHVILKMGRAKDWGVRDLVPNEVEIYDDDTINSDIYFAANGEIYSSCDLSYTEMKPTSKFHIGNWNSDFEEAVNKYNIKINKNVQ